MKRKNQYVRKFSFWIVVHVLEYFLLDVMSIYKDFDSMNLITISSLALSKEQQSCTSEKQEHMLQPWLML